MAWSQFCLVFELRETIKAERVVRCASRFVRKRLRTGAVPRGWVGGAPLSLNPCIRAVDILMDFIGQETLLYVITPYLVLPLLHFSPFCRFVARRRQTQKTEKNSPEQRRLQVPQWDSSQETLSGGGMSRQHKRCPPRLRRPGCRRGRATKCHTIGDQEKGEKKGIMEEGGMVGTGTGTGVREYNHQPYST